MKKQAWVTILVGLLFFYLCLYSPAVVNAHSDATSFKLPNGLRVILSADDNIEATCVLLYHLTGVRDDPPEIQGASHLYQNLMVLGTQTFDNFHRILFIKQNGGLSERIVDYDYSIFYQVIPASELDNALWLESERITSLRLNDRNITIEKNNLYTKNYRLVNSSVHVRASNWIKAKLFQGSIYETPIYGDLEKIRGFNNQAVRNLYTNFRNLSNIIMVITGKFNQPELIKSINKYFGSLSTLPGGAKSAKSYTTLGPRDKFETENWMVENLSDPFILYGIRGPAKFNLDHLYFDFIRYYLLDERISSLETELNQERNLNISISYEFLDYFEASALIVKISAKHRPNLERARYYLNRKLEALLKGTLSGTDINNTKTLMELDFMKSMTTLESRGAFLAESYYFTGELKGEQNHLNRIRKITTYDIFRIAQKYLKKENQVNLNVYSK